MNAALLCLVTLMVVSPFVFFAIYSRRETWMRLASVLGMLAIAPVVLAAYLVVLGTPAPLPVAKMLNEIPAHPKVIGAKIVIGRAIYVLLDTGESAPRYISFPFSKDLAEQLQQAMDGEEGAELDAGTRPGKPGAETWNNAPQFVPVAPPAPLPLKDGQSGPVINLDAKP